MSKVKFVGDPNDDFSGPSTMRLWGHEFPMNVDVEVPDSVAAKARTHNHFVVDGQEADAEAERFATIGLDELRDMLDVAGVEYNKNLGRAKLVELVKAIPPPAE